MKCTSYHYSFIATNRSRVITVTRSLIFINYTNTLIEFLTILTENCNLSRFKIVQDKGTHRPCVVYFGTTCSRCG